jgi:hypothetical protein
LALKYKPEVWKTICPNGASASAGTESPDQRTIVGDPKEDSVAIAIIHVELQQRPRYESVPEASGVTPETN